jgi:hypothetical protein
MEAPKVFIQVVTSSEHTRYREVEESVISVPYGKASRGFISNKSCKDLLPTITNCTVKVRQCKGEAGFEV